MPHLAFKDLGAVGDYCFFRKDEFVALLSIDRKEVGLYSLAQQKSVAKFDLGFRPSAGQQHMLTVSPDGRYAAVSEPFSGKVRLYSISSGKLIVELFDKGGDTLASMYYAKIQFSPDSTKLYAFRNHPSALVFWSVGPKVSSEKASSQRCDEVTWDGEIIQVSNPHFAWVFDRRDGSYHRYDLSPNLLGFQPTLTRKAALPDSLFSDDGSHLLEFRDDSVCYYRFKQNAALTPLYKLVPSKLLGENAICLARWISSDGKSIVHLHTHRNDEARSMWATVLQIGARNAEGPYEARKTAYLLSGVPRAKRAFLYAIKDSPDSKWIVFEGFRDLHVVDASKLEDFFRKHSEKRTVNEFLVEALGER